MEVVNLRELTVKEITVSSINPPKEMVLKLIRIARQLDIKSINSCIILILEKELLLQK